MELVAARLRPGLGDGPAARLAVAVCWPAQHADALAGQRGHPGFVTVKELTRGFAPLLDWPLWLATSLFATGFMDGHGSAATQIVPPLPWLAVVGLAALAGGVAGGGRLALLAAGCFLYLAWIGQWASAMTTLASIAVAVPLGAAGGLLIGIAAYRHPRFEHALTPTLDPMQTVPIFAYLVPVLFFFGFGPVAAMIATIVYAMPPMG